MDHVRGVLMAALLVAAVSPAGEVSMASLNKSFEQELLVRLSEVWTDLSVEEIQTIAGDTAEDVFGPHPDVLRAEASKVLGELPRIQAAELAQYGPHREDTAFSRLTGAGPSLLLLVARDPVQMARQAVQMAIVRSINTQEFGKRVLLSRLIPDRAFLAEGGDSPVVAVKSLGDLFLIDLKAGERGVCIPVRVRWMRKTQARPHDERDVPRQRR